MGNNGTWIHKFSIIKQLIKMTPEEFLQQLNPNSRVFDLSIDYKYTEEQLVLFAKLYHESELKKVRETDVSDTTYGIKWEIDHDYTYNSYLLSGDYKGQRFVKPVLDKFWGIPLMYAKWCIKRRYLILYGNII